MAFELPTAIYSQELLESVIHEIEQYLEWYQQVRIQSKVGSKLADEPAYSAETSLVIKTWFAHDKATTQSLGKLLEELRALKLPVVHITLAALPSHAQRAQLVDWFRRTAGRPLLVSFVADRNLGGGVVVRTPNHIFDYSWRERLLNGRSKLAEIVNRV